MFELTEKRKGRVDSITAGILTGWAISTMESRIPIYIWLDGNMIRSIVTETERPDVGTAFKINSDHAGFNINIAHDIETHSTMYASNTIQVSVTYDAVGEIHLENSPLTLINTRNNIKKISNSYPDSIAITFEEPLVALAVSKLPRLNFEITGAQINIDFNLLEKSFGVDSTIRLSEPSITSAEITSAINLLSRAKQQGNHLFEIKISSTKEKNNTITHKLTFANLASLFVGMLFQNKNKQPIDTSRSDISTFCFITQELIRERYLVEAEQLLIVLSKAITTQGQISDIDTWSRILDMLWSQKYWSLFGHAAGTLFLDPAVKLLIASGRRKILATNWLRLVKLVSGYPNYIPNALVFGERLAEIFPEVDGELDFQLKNKSETLITTEWADKFVIPFLSFFVDRPKLLRYFINLDLNTACLRISHGKIQNIKNINNINPLIEPIFLYIEGLLCSVTKIYHQDLADVFWKHLLECLVEGSLLHELIQSLNDPSAQVLRTNELEQLTADFLIFSSSSKRCVYSRLQALSALASRLDTWNILYETELQSRNYLHHFSSNLKLQPEVYMAYSHNSLETALIQISDDMSTLIELEGENEFPSSNMLVYDGVNLGCANLVGDLVQRLQIEISRGAAKNQTIIFAPWLSLGGADAYCATMANAILAKTGIPPTICTTESSIAEGISRLNKRIKLINLSPMLECYSEEDRAFALAMAIELIKPRLLINFNSKLLWKSLSTYFYRFNNSSISIGCMFFCDDIDKDGIKHSYLRQNSSIFSDGNIWAIGDSQTYFKKVCAEMRIPTKRTLGIYFSPLLSSTLANIKNDYKIRNRIFWSGRFDTQKRLDILVILANALPAVQFNIFGFPMLDSDPEIISELKSLSNVKECGKYTSFSEIDVQEYDCILMTTQWEGSPNILLEAGARGLPIIAPLVGGIEELLNNETGYPVKKYDRFSEFLSCIHSCLNDREEASRKAANMVKYVNTHHHASNLEEALDQLGC